MRIGIPAITVRRRTPACLTTTPGILDGLLHVRRVDDGFAVFTLAELLQRDRHLRFELGVENVTCMQHNILISVSVCDLSKAG